MGAETAPDPSRNLSIARLVQQTREGDIRATLSVRASTVGTFELGAEETAEKRPVERMASYRDGLTQQRDCKKCIVLARGCNVS